MKAFSKRPGSDNELDRRRVNERCNRIETDVVTNETCPCKQCLKDPRTALWFIEFCPLAELNNTSFPYIL